MYLFAHLGILSAYICSQFSSNRDDGASTVISALYWDVGKLESLLLSFFVNWLPGDPAHTPQGFPLCRSIFSLVHFKQLQSRFSLVGLCCEGLSGSDGFDYKRVIETVSTTRVDS